MRFNANPLYLLPVFLILSHLANAQVNTELFRDEDRAEGWFISLRSSLNLHEGNVRKLGTDQTLRVHRKYGNWYSFGVMNYQRGTVNEDLYLNKAFVHLRVIRHLNPLLNPEVFLQREFDDFILLSDRILAGGGNRFTFIDQKPGKSRVELALGLGMMYEEEHISEAVSLVTKILRSTNYLTFNIDVTERFQFSSTAYLQVDFNRFSDRRVLTDTHFRYTLTEHIALVSELHYRFDNEPPTDVALFDLKFTNGINVVF